MVAPTLVAQGVLFIAGLVLLGLSYLSYRDSEKPIETSFAALVALLSATAFCLAITAAQGWPGKLIWTHTNLLIPVALVFFSLDYYGINLFSTPERFGSLLTPVALGSLGGSLLILGTTGVVGGDQAPISALAGFPAIVYDFAGAFDQIGYYYTVALILVAIGLVFRNVLRYDHLDSRLAVAIAFIGFWPWFGNFVVPNLAVAQSHQAAMVSLATGYSISATIAVGVVGPLGLFESSPGAGNVGAEKVLDSMDDAVFMVDDRDQILRLNAVACGTFGIDETGAVGRPIEDIIGQSATELSTTDRLEAETVDGVRQFEVTRSPVRDRWEDERGSVVVLRDVTQRLTREQQLEVLNRVLRHNLRNNASSIIGRAELISDGESQEEFAEDIIDTTRDLMSAAERAREIENMMDAATSKQSTDLHPVVDAVVDQVEAEYPDIDITTGLPDDATVGVSSIVLETVLYNLVENAARHNDADQPIVVISADQTEEDQLSIAISDNGPGIPEHERTVLRSGEEDQLSHGSGLGLWAAYWGITQMGGDLAISDNDPRGAVVTVTVPRASAAEPPEQAEPVAT